MKVKKTLHQIYGELNSLYDQRDSCRNMIADVAANEKVTKEYSQRTQDKYIQLLRDVNEAIHYLSTITVEYEDKYEVEEDE